MMGRPRSTIPVGAQYNRLVVVGEAPRYRTNMMVEAECACGVKIVVRFESLRSGHTRSCGCLHRELSAAQVRAVRLTHGASRTPEYAAWRGIRWKPRPTFEAFLEQLGPSPSPRHRLARVDVTRPRELDNIEWRERHQTRS